MTFVYPDEDDLRTFVKLITDKKYNVSRYVPNTSDFWFETICDCIDYVKNTAHYEEGATIHTCAARLLYKVAKRHELGDGNKRSAVIAVYLFVILNDYTAGDPKTMKNQALRAARSKGRSNEPLLKRRIAKVFETTMKPMPNSSIGPISANGSSA